MHGVHRAAAPAVALALLVSGCLAGPPPQGDLPPAPEAPLAPVSADPAAWDAAGLRPALAAEVRAELLRAYLAYLRLAGGRDELRPVSGTGMDFFAEGHPVRLTTIEALDNLHLMGLDAELREAADLAAEVDFDIDADFPFLESVIRLLGGLLAGYHATGDDRLLAKAEDVGARLLPAYASPTGMPYKWVNLRTGAAWGRVNFLAEVGTGVTEFGELSRLTGDPRYLAAAKAALVAAWDRRTALDLVGTTIDVDTGAWIDTASTVNPPVDSFFESLHDGHDLLGDAGLGAMHATLMEAMVQRQLVKVRALPPGAGLLGGGEHAWFATVDAMTGAPLRNLQFEMGSFYAGLLAQSGRLEEARASFDAWTAALRLGGWRVHPECLDPVTLQAPCRANFLRPEYVDAAFHLWLATGDPAYVDRAAEAWEAMKATSRVPNGYTILLDATVQPEVQGDSLPAYWFSENMKYLYLMFARTPRFDYEDPHLTTEGNVLRGLRPG